MTRLCFYFHLFSLIFAASKSSSYRNRLRYSNNNNNEGPYLFESDILLTREEAQLMQALQVPPPIDGNNARLKRRLDSDIANEGFIPMHESRNLQQPQRRKKRAATAIASKLWENATIPFVIGPSVAESMKENIFLAMSHWESNTCIRFVKRTTEDNFVLFEPGPCGCCSYVGRKGKGVQDVTLSPQCASYGVVIHELGHVIGFWHEHSRPDRDQFIDILRENVIPEKLDNFDKKTAIEIDSLGESYDYDSIMHYRKRTFSRNGLDTMMPKSPAVKIGQRKGLSPGDIAQTGLLYSCPKPTCHVDFTSMESAFTSPYYPQKYSRDMECTWVIHVSPGELVTLEFIDFALERSSNCTFDYLEIREGLDGEGKLIGRMCGEGVPGTFQVSNSLWIKFLSDDEYHFRGFWAHYLKTVVSDFGSGEADESGDVPWSRYASQPSTIYLANCNHVLKEVSGSVSSPLMPIMYDGQPIECAWTIDGGANASRIQLTIDTPPSSVGAEQCLGDVYKMTSPRRAQAKKRTDKKGNKTIRKKTTTGTHEAKGVKETVKGYTAKPVQYNCRQSDTLLLSSHSVIIQWSSRVNQPIGFSYVIDYDECRQGPCDHKCDNTLTGFSCSCDSGFNLNSDGRTCAAKVLPPVADKCGEVITSERGVISATNSTNLRDCGWYIQPREDLRVFLTFVKFLIPAGISSHTCVENHVEIRVGSNLTSRVKYCDRKVPPALALPPGKVMIRLRTKFHRAGVQPQFTVNFLLYKNSAKDCQQKIKGQGEVQYPESSKQYGAYVLCSWYVSARPGYRLRLHFTEMDIELTEGCHFDFVQVRSGHLATSPLKGQFCGRTTPPDVITGTQMLIIFASDGNGFGHGFKASVTSVKRRPKGAAKAKKTS